MDKINIYVVIVAANLFLTLGNAIQGKKLAEYDPITICGIIFAGKLLVGLVAYGVQSQFSWTELNVWTVLALLGVGTLTGIGEICLFNGLVRSTLLVSAMGCLYPLFLAGFAALLSKEVPHPLMIAAVALSGVAMYLAHIASTLQTTAPPG